MLARIAAETFERNEYFIPQGELERLITDYVRNVPPHDAGEAADGETILKAVAAQHGIFVERAREVYSFSHLTFQEYLTAKYVVANAARGALTNLVKAHCMDGRWREVFLLTTSLLPDAGEFMMTFGRGVDELLEGEGKLNLLLARAGEKAASTQAASWSVRLCYLYAELSYPSLSRYSALYRPLVLDRDRDLGLALALDLDLDLISALGRAIALDRALERARDQDGDLDLDLALDLAHTLDIDIDGDFDIDGDINIALDRARTLGLHEFAKELEELSISVKEATNAEWREYANRLRALMIKHRDIGHEWDLTETQEAQLADYLNASRLLKDCLELAFMPPDEKKAMLNSLYLPPAQAGEEKNA
jgi:hypothetical protein